MNSLYTLYYSCKILIYKLLQLAYTIQIYLLTDIVLMEINQYTFKWKERCFMRCLRISVLREYSLSEISNSMCYFLVFASNMLTINRTARLLKTKLLIQGWLFLSPGLGKNSLVTIDLGHCALWHNLHRGSMFIAGSINLLKISWLGNIFFISVCKDYSYLALF